ncbi:MAG: GGDEF domain-containing protein [Treponema sp.]|jgi:diguanylate cyclase (GGDEF)-like protein|nr:GGDEF domain-containing protein [Treponema sp.]
MKEDAENLDFLSNPKVIENYIYLEEMGVFRLIDKFNSEIKNCKNLLTAAVDIFNKITVDEILDAAVWSISYRFLPSFITFLWKPSQNRDDVTILSYKNYKKVAINVPIQTITPFIPFFRKFPKPAAFDVFSSPENNVDISVLNILAKIDPELIIPILSPFGFFGVVLVGKKITEKGYASDELFFLEQLMSFVSQAVQNNIHYEHSVRDVKTGLYNHGYFMSRLDEELARTRRESAVSSVIVMDVDRFKDFNDSYGHLAGDCVLENLAKMIKQTVRTGDIPSRFGGEEFTILLPNTSQQTAWLVAERLRMAVAAMQVAWDIPLPQVTISLGLVSFDSRSNVTSDRIISRADEALYKSKQNGRNRTSVWGAGLLFKVQCSLDPGSASA